MINELYANKFCKEDIRLIENYDMAINDNSQTWECHHRDEIRFLPSGMVVIRSKKELIENNRYYNCPANELIFLTKSEHSRLHSLYKNKERLEKFRENRYKFASYGMQGKIHNAASKTKTSLYHKNVRKLFLEDNKGLTWNEFQRWYKCRSKKQ